MHKTISLVAIAIALVALIGWSVQGCVDTEHRYRIDYPAGRYTYSDYTDSFVVEGGIRYVNDKGDSVHRYGTFSVSDNSDYKK